MAPESQSLDCWCDQFATMAPTPEDITSIAVALLAGSELLAIVPGVRANSWTQLILGALRGIASRKR